jgi:threonine synthase
MWDGPRLYLKNETASPTWAWKDRCNCVSISMARELGFRKVAVVTTGNHGMAAAAYSAAAGLECVVFCHAETPPLQLAVIQAYGACVFRGGRREEMLTRLVRRGGWFPASIYCPRDGCANPFGVEGFKTIAFEVVEQLGRVPDAVFVPVGSGDGFYGIWKGFRELRQVGAITHTPRMYICQAAGANSYERAFQRNATRLVPLESVDTIALSIAENIGGDHALRAVYEAGGSVLSATDDEILAAMRVLARRGLALEPASAASLACANKVAAEAARDALWVAIGTGASIKWPDAQTRAFKAPETLPPDFADVEHLLNLEAMK